METVIFDQTPLAEYLEDGGEEKQPSWDQSDSEAGDSSPSPSPSFAPKGRPVVKSRFRSKIPSALRLDIPSAPSISQLQNKYQNAVNSRIDRADNSKFLEQFRYTIVASQLLSGHSILAQHHGPVSDSSVETTTVPSSTELTSAGAVTTAALALALAWIIKWFAEGGFAAFTKKRVVFVLVLAALAVFVFQAYMRRQWLRYVRDQASAEVTNFVARAQDLDSATSAAMALIQEVELVSRGYRLSTPLPPITRIEDRSQTRRCQRLRKALRVTFSDVISKYNQTASVTKSFSEQLDMEKYYDIYDISDFDISDALQGYSETEFDDIEGLRALKIAAARFHTIRKIFLCSLLALEATGDNPDFLRWTTAVEGLRELNKVTKGHFERLRNILSEEQSFPTPPTPKVPLTPGRERWRSQLRKLNSLTTGIRGLQAKLHLLREESDKSLNEADDVSELGSNLLAQYESIGQDLKSLMQAWEEGKAALASGIDRNERRLSSMSALFSPASSWSGLTTVEEGGALEALKALNGETPPHSDFGSPGSPPNEEVYEAISSAPIRPRSMFTREERIIKMREERERKEEVRMKAEANRGMLRELEMVINLRPKGGRPASTGSRIVSV